MCVSVYFCFQPAHTNSMLLLWPALITERDVDPGVSACEVFIFCILAMTLQKVPGHSVCCPCPG